MAFWISIVLFLLLLATIFLLLGAFLWKHFVTPLIDEDNPMQWPDDDWDEVEREMAREDLERERRIRLLMRYPHCQDPDHPGCSLCESVDEEEEAI